MVVVDYEAPDAEYQTALLASGIACFPRLLCLLDIASDRE